MSHSEQGAIYHENLKLKLKACCDECPFKSTNRACKKSKIDCSFYNLTIAEFVNTTYPSMALTRIPVESFVRGIRAHGYTGEVRQTKITVI